MLRTFLRSTIAPCRDDRGATAVEYGILAAVVGLGILAAVQSARDGIKGTFQAVAAQVSGAAEVAPPAPPSSVFFDESTSQVSVGAGMTFSFNALLESQGITHNGSGYWGSAAAELCGFENATTTGATCDLQNGVSTTRVFEGDRTDLIFTVAPGTPAVTLSGIFGYITAQFENRLFTVVVSP